MLELHTIIPVWYLVSKGLLQIGIVNVKKNMVQPDKISNQSSRQASEQRYRRLEIQIFKVVACEILVREPRMGRKRPTSHALFPFLATLIVLTS
jgi:hypothetical protein